MQNILPNFYIIIMIINNINIISILNIIRNYIFIFTKVCFAKVKNET